MAKARGDGTPAKASTSASGKKKTTTPAKKTRAKSESPERRITRSSPRRTTLSLKAQEAAAASDKVQTGRVAKKACSSVESPAKAKAQTPAAKKKGAFPRAKSPKSTTPVTKASSPAKVARATTPAPKAGSPAKGTKASPAKAIKRSLSIEADGVERPKIRVYDGPRATVTRILAPPPTKKGNFGSTRARVWPENVVAVDAGMEHSANLLTRWMEMELKDSKLTERALIKVIELLRNALAQLGEHDAKGPPLDDPRTRRLRSICRNLWLTLRRGIGSALDDCLDKDIPEKVFLRAFLRAQGLRADGSKREPEPQRVWDLDEVRLLGYKGLVDLYGKHKRENKIASSPPRSPPRSASEEQRGWWDYWEDHPDSDDEGFPFIFSRAAAQDAERLLEHARNYGKNVRAAREASAVSEAEPTAKRVRSVSRGTSPAKATRASLSEEEDTETLSRRTVSQVLEGPPKGKSPATRISGDGVTMGYGSLSGAPNEEHSRAVLQRHADEMARWMEHELTAEVLEDRHFSYSYYILARGISTLAENDAMGLDNSQIRQLRSICRQLRMILREVVGDALDRCLEQDVPSHIFLRAFVSVQGPRKRIESGKEGDYGYGWPFDDIMPLDYYEDVAALFEEYKRERELGNASDTGDEARSQGPRKARAASRKESGTEPTAKRARSVSRAASPAKRANPRSSGPVQAPAPAAPPSTRSRSRSPEKSSSRSKPAEYLPSYPPGTSHKNERGKIVSPTNPATITALNKPNPFHETLPAPEVWHRRMPPFFTFGETPYMQRVVSDQIQEDLDRNVDDRVKAARAKESWLKRATGMFGSLGGMLSGSPAKQQSPYPSPWDLPDVNDSEVEVETEVQGLSGQAASSASRGASKKKKKVSPRKIPQQDSEDEGFSDDDNGDYMMTGGLH